MEREYDIFLRLQILEGALGVAVDRWWRAGAKSFGEIAAFMQSRGVGEKIDPQWFSPSDTDVVDALTASLRRVSPAIEPVDTINDALLGIPVDPSSGKMTLRAPYEVGEYLSDKILRGKVSPRKVAEGLLGHFLGRKAMTGALRDARPSVRADELDFLSQPPEAVDLLALIIFRDMADPLGREIRAFMRATWASGHKEHAALRFWLDGVERGVLLRGQDIAAEFHVSPQCFGQYLWARAWREFFEALWVNESLLLKLRKRYEHEGVEWSQEKPDLDQCWGFLPKR